MVNFLLGMKRKGKVDGRPHAYKTMKTAAAAVKDLWVSQAGEEIEYQGTLFKRSDEDPRSAAVKAILKQVKVTKLAPCEH